MNLLAKLCKSLGQYFTKKSGRQNAPNPLTSILNIFEKTACSTRYIYKGNETNNPIPTDKQHLPNLFKGVLSGEFVNAKNPSTEPINPHTPTNIRSGSNNSIVTSD